MTQALLILGPRFAGQSSALAACHHYGWQVHGHLSLHQVDALLAQLDQPAAITLADQPTMDDWQRWQTLCPALQGLYLDADLDVLVQRANLSDVPHPLLTARNTLGQLLVQEQTALAPFKKLFTFSLNTGDFTPDAFRYKMGQILGAAHPKPPNLQLCLWSFGFKYGIPLEANWVFDVRFIPNPFYIPELRPMTGLDTPIQDYVMGHDVARHFVHHTAQLVKQAAPLYPAQGLDRLVVAIGCTGGKHRSVTLIEKLAAELQTDYPTVQILHREQSGWKRAALTAIG
jgi:RNase adapter protein RapZ